MAEQVRLAAQPRTGTGKSVARRLRAEGRVPAVVYGKAAESAALHVDALELFHALHTPAGLNVLIRINVNGEEHLTIPREVQRHPVRGDLLHVDFVAIHREQLLRLEVPIHLEGQESLAAPGVLTQVLHTIPILVRPLDIPDRVELDVGGMVIGDLVRAEDVRLPQGAKLDVDPDTTVVTVSAPTVFEPTEAELPEVPEDLASLMEAGDLPAGPDAGVVVASPDELKQDVKGEGA